MSINLSSNKHFTQERMSWFIEVLYSSRWLLVSLR